MSVAGHLKIRLAEYDHRIHTFIPHYSEMLDVTADAIDPRARTIVDLGIGTGTLAARCLARAKRARVVGIDADPAILEMAARRLGRRATFVTGNFLRADLPPADAIVASLALHHVRTRGAKLALYRRIRAALRPGGLFVSADRHPSSDRRLAAAQRASWKAHMRARYGTARAERFLRAWAREDAYMPLDAELALIEECGLRADVLWRREGFAVVTARR